MLALFFISVACFFALFLAMLALLRNAARRGAAARAVLHGIERRAADGARAPAPERAVPATAYDDEALAGSRPSLRNKQPDWRFLVRDGRRPFPSGQVVAPARRPPQATGRDKVRADWAHYNKDLGDLQDPYQAAPTTARRA